MGGGLDGLGVELWKLETSGLGGSRFTYDLRRLFAKEFKATWLS